MDSLDKLNEFPWRGLAVIMGKVKQDWHDTDTVLRILEKGLEIASDERILGGG